MSTFLKKAGMLVSYQGLIAGGWEAIKSAYHKVFRRFHRLDPRIIIRRLRLWLRFQPIGLTGRWVEAYGSESRLTQIKIRLKAHIHKAQRKICS
jgi:hypothetical protein